MLRATEKCFCAPAKEVCVYVCVSYVCVFTRGCIQNFEESCEILNVSTFAWRARSNCDKHAGCFRLDGDVYIFPTVGCCVVSRVESSQPFIHNYGH